MAQLGSSHDSFTSATRHMLKDYIGLQTLLDTAVLTALNDDNAETREELRAIMAGFMGTLVTLSEQPYRDAAVPVA